MFAYKKKLYISSVNSYIREVFDKCGVELVKIERVPLMSYKNTDAYNDVSTYIRSLIHVYCHTIVKNNKEVFDRLEDKLLQKASDLGYYVPDQNFKILCECNISN